MNSVNEQEQDHEDPGWKQDGNHGSRMHGGRAITGMSATVSAAFRTTTSPGIVDGHRKLATMLATMVAAARAGNWQPLAALDARCVQQFDALRRLDVEHVGPDEHVQLLILAQQIRADQQELEDLLRPQFLQLAARMAHRAEAQPPRA